MRPLEEIRADLATARDAARHSERYHDATVRLLRDVAPLLAYIERLDAALTEVHQRAHLGALDHACSDTISLRWITERAWGALAYPDTMPEARVTVHHPNGVTQIVGPAEVGELPDGVTIEHGPCAEPGCGADFCEHEREARFVGNCGECAGTGRGGTCSSCNGTGDRP